MGLIKTIKDIYNNLAFNLDIKKPNALLEKIRYLKSKKIYPYGGIYRIKKLRACRTSIVDYITLIDAMRHFKYADKVFIDSVSFYIANEITLSDWFCSNGFILNNHDETFKLWLDKCEKLVLLYETFSLDNENSNIANNFKYYQPYIINIEKIIDLLIECVSS